MRGSCLPLMLLAAFLATGSPAPAGEFTAPSTLQNPKRRKPPKKDRVKKAPKPEKVVAHLAKELKKLLAAKGNKDAAAVKVIGEMTDQARLCKAKGRKTVAAHLARVFACKRSPEETRIFSAAVDGLSTLGAEAARCLEKPINLPAFRTTERIPLRSEMIKIMGRGGNPGSLKTLLGLLKEEDGRILAATLEGLGSYGKAKDKTRKLVTGKVMDGYANMSTGKPGANPDAEPTPLQRRKQQSLQKAFDTCLKALTGQNLSGFDSWNTWWNKNKSGKKKADRKKRKSRRDRPKDR